MNSAFAELGLDAALYEESGYTRHRQHVNPLKAELQAPAEPPVYAEAYAEPARPLVLDIGCGYGRFLLALSKVLPEHNMLGLEIRSAVRSGRVWGRRLAPPLQPLLAVVPPVCLRSLTAAHFNTAPPLLSPHPLL